MFLVQMVPFWRLAQNTYLYHYIFTHHLLYTLLEYRVFLPLPGAIHFPFSWLSVFWRQTMAHDCIGRSGLASARFKCATASKSTTVSSQFIDHVDFVVMWRVCCWYLFLLLPSFISFHGPYSLRYWCLFLGTLKELIFDSVFCLQSSVSRSFSSLQSVVGPGKNCSVEWSCVLCNSST